MLNAIASHHPWLIGGAADLSPSTKTRLLFEGAGDLEADTPGGRNMHFGIREHAMGAVLNGLALSKVRAFGSGFLIFSRLYETAYPVERPDGAAGHLCVHARFDWRGRRRTHTSTGRATRALRSIPGLITLRPADANEAVEAWRVVISLKHQPACLVLSRQPLPTLDRTRFAPANGVARGAYILADANGRDPSVILIGTGSEVALCVDAYESLTREGIAARVISMPSWELFEQQDQAYRDSVLPPEVTARVSVEQGSVIGWDHYVGTEWREDRHAHLRFVSSHQGLY